MSQLPLNPSESTKRRNPHIYGALVLPVKAKMTAPDPPKKRVRQSAKPLLNKLEQEWFDYLRRCSTQPFHAQAVTFRLCNGVRYTPDVWSSYCARDDGSAGPTAFEVKGKQPIQDDASVKLKMAAQQFPEIRFILVWKEEGQWRQQIILP